MWTVKGFHLPYKNCANCVLHVVVTASVFIFAVAAPPTDAERMSHTIKNIERHVSFMDSSSIYDSVTWGSYK